MWTLPAGSVPGYVRNADGVPVGARVRLTGIGPDAFGRPGFIVRGERNSDPATGRFLFYGQALAGNWGLQAASPFSPVVATASGFTTPEAPDAEGIVLQFPPEPRQVSLCLGHLEFVFRDPCFHPFLEAPSKFGFHLRPRGRIRGVAYPLSELSQLPLFPVPLP